MDGNNGYKIEIAKFTGEVTEALKNLREGVGEIKSDMKDLKKCIDKTNIRVACIGGTVSLIVTIVVLLVKSMLAGG